VRQSDAERERSGASKRLPAAARPPWSVEEGETYFVVKDNDGQHLADVHFDDPRSAAKPLNRDEARRIAANIAKLCHMRARKTSPSCPSSSLSSKWG
jgi:hypothetical protein